MQILLALHIISMVAWFSGLFYLPRLFVYHADAQDTISLERFNIMERRLFKGIIMPASLLTAVFGFWILSAHASWYVAQPWMQAKLFLVVLLWIYQGWCARFIMQFKQNKNTKSALFFRCFNEVPTVFLVAIVFLVMLK